MLHMVRLDRNIPADRHVEFDLPDDFPTGDAELVLIVVSKAPASSVAGDDQSATNDEFIKQRRELWLGHDE